MNEKRLTDKEVEQYVCILNNEYNQILKNVISKKDFTFEVTNKKFCITIESFYAKCDFYKSKVKKNDYIVSFYFVKKYASCSICSTVFSISEFKEKFGQCEFILIYIDDWLVETGILKLEKVNQLSLLH